MTVVGSLLECNISPYQKTCNARLSREIGEGHRYAVVRAGNGKERLLIDRYGNCEKHPTISIVELSALSSFATRYIKQVQQGDAEFATKKFENKFATFIHLNEIRHHVESHNSKIDRSFWIGMMHVILLVVTLGMFSLKNLFKIEEFSLKLSDFELADSIEKEQFWVRNTLSIRDFINLSELDRSLVLSKIQIYDEGKAYLAAHPNFVKEVSRLPSELLGLNLTETISWGLLRFLDMPIEKLVEVSASNSGVSFTSKEDFKLLHYCLNTHSPISSSVQLDPNQNWGNVPYNQLWRMMPENFLPLCKRQQVFQSSSSLRSALPFFSWECRKALIEECARSYSTYLDAPIDRGQRVKREIVVEKSDLKFLFHTETYEDKKKLRAEIATLSLDAQKLLPASFYPYLPAEFIRQINWGELDQNQVKDYLENLGPGSLACAPISNVKQLLLAENFLSISNPSFVTFTSDIINQIGFDWFANHKEAFKRIFSSPGFHRIFSTALDLSVRDKITALKDEKLFILHRYFSVADWEQIDFSEIKLSEEIESNALYNDWSFHFPFNDVTETKLVEMLTWAKGKVWNDIEFTIVINRLNPERQSLPAIQALIG